LALEKSVLALLLSLLPGCSRHGRAGQICNIFVLFFLASCGFCGVFLWGAPESIWQFVCGNLMNLDFMMFDIIYSFLVVFE